MSPGWADVQQGLVRNARVVAQAAAQLAGRPDGDDARDMLRLALAAQESWVELARRWVLDEAVLDAERKRAFEEGFAAGQALRGRLSLVSSG